MIQTEGISKVGGAGSEIAEVDMVKLEDKLMTDFEEDLKIIDDNFLTIYSLDLTTIENVENYRAIRLIIKQERKYIDYVVYSQPYYLDTYSKNIY